MAGESRVLGLAASTTTLELPNEQLLLAAHAKVRGWLIPFDSRIVMIAPQQNCGR
jgi:hypothetical protein